MTTANFKVKIRRKRVGRHGRVEPCGTQNGFRRVNNTRRTPQEFSCVMPHFVNGYERIMNGL